MNEFSGPLEGVARVIELAVAPVFLLTAVGTILGVLSNRLARIIDRARVLNDRLPRTEPGGQAAIHRELELLIRRRTLVNFAITFGTMTALLVCMLIAAAFISAMLQVNASMAVAVLFVLAMFSFIGALLFFLREIVLAASSTPIESFRSAREK